MRTLRVTVTDITVPARTIKATSSEETLRIPVHYTASEETLRIRAHYHPSDPARSPTSRPGCGNSDGVSPGEQPPHTPLDR